MNIKEIFYLNLGATIILGIVLLVLPFVFWYQRKKYLERKRREF